MLRLAAGGNVVTALTQKKKLRVKLIGEQMPN
jgi:hypothetical protein